MIIIILIEQLEIFYIEIEWLMSIIALIIVTYGKKFFSNEWIICCMGIINKTMDLVYLCGLEIYLWCNNNINNYEQQEKCIADDLIFFTFQVYAIVKKIPAVTAGILVAGTGIFVSVRKWIKNYLRKNLRYIFFFKLANYSLSMNT